jgi:hypothetical protein
MAWNLDDYETVESRLDKFWNDFPAGRLETELLAHAGDRFIVLARLYRDSVDTLVFATGMAEETITERGVNSTSALENCETSAIGRALANAGYAAKGKRPSREEMTKVVKGDAGHKVEHPFKPVEAVREIPNEPDTLAWDDEIEETRAFKDTTDIVKALGGEIVSFDCQHGAMLRKEGTSKAGKPYFGFVCTAKTRAEQCDAKWGKQGHDGKWVFEDKAAW